jgi:hypothetical protein
MRTGPWDKCIVMTTAHSLKREGQITSKDVFWGYSTFVKLKRHDWLSIIGLKVDHTCGSTRGLQTELDIREARLKYFS